MPKGKRKYKRKTKRKLRVRKPLMTGFPESQLCKLTSFHQGTLDPASSSAVAYLDVNINNPVNPLGAGVTWTTQTSEHHPKNWDLFESIWSKYRVVSAKVTAQFLNDTHDGSVAMFIVPSSAVELTKTIAVVTDTSTFATRFKEMNKRASIMFAASTAEQAGHYTLSNKVNINKIEGVKSRGDSGALELQGNTSGSTTESEPTRTPKMFVGIGALGAAADLPVTFLILKIEYIILFSGVRGTREGVDV